MPRGRKRPARSQRRVEPRTTSREPQGSSKRRRVATRQPPVKRRNASTRTRTRTRTPESSRSSSSSSDWSSSRERKESKQRREIAERARATEPPRRKTAARKSKNKKVSKSKKPANPVEPPGDHQGNEFTVVHRRKNSGSESNPANSGNASPGPSESNQPGPSCSPPPEQTPSEGNLHDGSVPCCIPRCPWRGPADSLPDHVDEEHADLVLSGASQQLEVPVYDPQRGAALTRVLQAFGEMFAVHIRRPPNANEVLGCVQLLGPPERACDFIYQMEVRDENGETPNAPLKHCPLIANTSSSREFDISETLKQVCLTEQADVDSGNEPNWGDRGAITIEVKISTSPDSEDPDEETTRSSPPPELSFMWM